ncbi:MAG: ligase-associated DNA damage response endonuclease PdeM [Bacteroidia bacterium]|nr:ligase-associated DNA damage response endonuclease PdeM [Bacteroidia bacterium]
MNITLNNQNFRVFPQKALFWTEKKFLLVADVHLGKISHFRKAGIPIPAQGINRNFQILDELIQESSPIKLFFLGDLFHSDYNSEWELFCQWRNSHANLEMAIVLGNHDVLPASLYQQANLETYPEEYLDQSICLRHSPLTVAHPQQAYVISGHLHPCFNLYGKGRQHLRLPCFYFGKNQTILPSFGHFTGGFAIEPESNETIVCVSENQLIPINF